MTGTAGQQRVPAAFLGRFEIPLPPLSEQKRIADILDKADMIRRKREQELRHLAVMRRSIFLDVFGSPRANPKEWPVGTIRDLVTQVSYGTSVKSDVAGPTPILRMNNITADGLWDLAELKYTDVPTEQHDRFLVRRGDLLFNRTNSKELVGKSAVYDGPEPMAYAGYLIRVRANERATTEYIAGYLNSTHGNAVLRHMCKNIIGMANINAQELQDIRIAVPPFALQKEYGNILAALKNAAVKWEQGVAAANELFASLCQRAFLGEL